MRQCTIHSSLNRLITIFGGDRIMVLSATAFCVLLGYTLFWYWWGAPVSVLLWLGAVALCHRLHKADPHMRQVAWRHWGYADYYPAKSRLHGWVPAQPRSWT